MEGVVYVVTCKKHGKLGEVVSTALGMILFDGHRQMMDEDCEGCNITPKKEAEKNDNEVWAFIPP